MALGTSDATVESRIGVPPIGTAEQSVRVASAWSAFRSWTPRRWWSALGGAVATALLVGLPTDVIPNPVFGRPVAVTWWSYPTLVVTAVLGGLLLATYVRAPGAEDVPLDRPGRLGGIGGLLSFFAVGCPVCNKLVLVALGSSGAMNVFAPVQPFLAAASVVVLAIALRVRLRDAGACRV